MTNIETTSIAQAARTRNAWPLHVIDAANDAPAMEQSDAFVAALRSVLAKVSSTPMEMP